MRNASFTGRLGKDPETRQAGSSSVTKANIAVDCGKDRDGNKRTMWVTAEVWGKHGETMATWLHKGDPIEVQGDLWNEEYQGKMYLKLENASWGFVQKTNSQAAPTPSYDAGDYTPPAGDDDDIPF